MCWRISVQRDCASTCARGVRGLRTDSSPHRFVSAPIRNPHGRHAEAHSTNVLCARALVCANVRSACDDAQSSFQCVHCLQHFPPLPNYPCRDEALTAAFSAIAPVKRAFVVKNAATNASRGFGFVQLCVRPDLPRIESSALTS